MATAPGRPGTGSIFQGPASSAGLATEVPDRPVDAEGRGLLEVPDHLARGVENLDSRLGSVFVLAGATGPGGRGGAGVRATKNLATRFLHDQVHER